MHRLNIRPADEGFSVSKDRSELYMADSEAEAEVEVEQPNLPDDPKGHAVNNTNSRNESSNETSNKRPLLSLSGGPVHSSESDDKQRQSRAEAPHAAEQSSSVYEHRGNGACGGRGGAYSVSWQKSTRLERPNLFGELVSAGRAAPCSTQHLG